MPCRGLRFVLSVVFYVVNENPQSRILSKSCKKQKKTPEIRRFRVLFWSCWADSNRRPHPYQLQNDCFSLLLVIVTYCLQPFDCNGCGVFFAIVCRFVLYLKSSCFLIPVSVLCRFLKMQSDKTSSLFGSISEHGRRGDSSPVPFSRIYSRT